MSPGKMIRILSGLRRKPGRGIPFLDLSPGDGGRRSPVNCLLLSECLRSAWPRSGFGGGRAAAAAGRGSPVSCLLLLKRLRSGSPLGGFAGGRAAGVAWQKAPLWKGGRLRAPPVAEKASKKEWQWSKFCERMRAKYFGYHDRRPKRQRRLVGGGHALGTTGAGARRATEGSSAETFAERIIPVRPFYPLLSRWVRELKFVPPNAFLPPFRWRLPGGGEAPSSNLPGCSWQGTPSFRPCRRLEMQYGKHHDKRTGPGADPEHRQE